VLEGDFKNLNRPMDSARLSASNNFLIWKNCFLRAAWGGKFGESTPHCHATRVIYEGSSKTKFTIKSGICRL
jgi:hypothetical protein